MPVSTSEHKLRTEDLDYELPAHLIATRPAEPRDSARMLVVRRSNSVLEHRHIRDLPEYLSAGDALVFNTTAVAPARLVGRRAGSGGNVEGLFLHELPHTGTRLRWLVMLKGRGRLRQGDRIHLMTSSGSPSPLSIDLINRQDEQWEVELEGCESSATALDAVGWTPLPPYILQARGKESFSDAQDRAWYQTVYADRAKRQSVAAPTAGLHFTPELLQRIQSQGVQRIDVTLHVGTGTFKPITAQTLDQHRMHAEWFEVSPDAIAALVQRRGPTIAVGTTSVRTLETLPRLNSQAASAGKTEFCGRIAGMTDLLIAPPYEFKNVDGMLTNFHLPRSTLLALVAAMVGLERLKSVYSEAIARAYRVYSYGDAMLILP